MKTFGGGFFWSLVFLVSLGCLQSLQGQDSKRTGEQRHDFRVKLKVGCSDANTRSLLESYLKREFRSLGDVEMVETNAFFEMECVVAPIQLETNKHDFGYAISILVSEPLDPSYWEVWQKMGKLDSESVKTLQKALSGMRVNLKHELLLAPIDSLKKNCESIVASFDTTFLEPHRKLIQGTRDLDGTPQRK